jgi:hypothetical protein
MMHRAGQGWVHDFEVSCRLVEDLLLASFVTKSLKILSLLRIILLPMCKMHLQRLPLAANLKSVTMLKR